MNKIKNLVGMLVGFSLAVFCLWVGFAMSAGGHGSMNFGAIGGLFYFNEFLYLFGVPVGGLLVAFPLSDLWYCLRDTFILPEPESSADPINHDLRKNAMICQLASRLAILTGIIASIAGFIIVMMYKIGGDTALVGQGIATAAAAMFWGLVLAALFTSLKFRFLAQVQYED